MIFCVDAEERKPIYILERYALSNPTRLLSPYYFLCLVLFFNVNIRYVPLRRKRREIYTAICIYFINQNAKTTTLRKRYPFGFYVLLI